MRNWILCRKQMFERTWKQMFKRTWKNLFTYMHFGINYKHWVFCSYWCKFITKCVTIRFSLWKFVYADIWACPLHVICPSTKSRVMSAVLNGIDIYFYLFSLTYNCSSMFSCYKDSLLPIFQQNLNLVQPCLRWSVWILFNNSLLYIHRNL